MIKLKTSNRFLDAKIIGDSDVQLKMGKPLFEWDKIPLIKKIEHNNITLNIDDKIFTDGFCLNVGNPHIIFFVKDCFEYDLKILGPKIENHELFPEKINVTFAHINDKNNITVNVWERGAGLTKACGTAACATAVASLIKKLTKNDINIKFKEGSLNIKIDESLNIFMTGPVSDISDTKLEI
jgi:diaminopimelate epimerase